MMKGVYDDRYQRVQRVGNGAYGVIYKVRCIEDGKILIAKHIHLGDVSHQKALQEFKILQKLRHNYIVRYVDSFTEEEELVIIMEYCGQKDLAWHIEQRRKTGKHFSQFLVTNWLLQMLLAVGFMHGNRIVHRDLKPHNVFVDSEMNLKVGDFGVSKALDSTGQHCDTSAGTPSYMAPQMVESQHYNYKADVWSLGCILYEVCALEKLFPPKDAQNKPVGIFRMMQLIRSGELKNIPNCYSAGLNRIVKKMLTRNPDKRPNVEQLLKDDLLVKLMINHVKKENSLKSQYPKQLEQPSLSNSLLNRQAASVQDQLKKMEEEVSQKLAALKEKKVQKRQLQNYEQQIKQKMKQVEAAVNNAFAQLRKKGKFIEEGPNKVSESSASSLKGTIRSKNVSKLSSNESDATIMSMQLASMKKPSQEQESMELVESLMLNSKAPPAQSNLSQTVNSEYEQTLNRKVQDPFETTVQSQYANTYGDANTVNKTMNKLQMLQQTLKSNPQAVMSDSFMNCTLSLSSDPVAFKKKEEDLGVSGSIDFNLTKRAPPQQAAKEKTINNKSSNSSLASSGPVMDKVNSKEIQEVYDEEEYQADFEEYDENEQLSNRRADQMKTMLSLYEQTLAEYQRQQKAPQSTHSRLRNKYLVMSQIREQSNEGGSMVSRQEDI